MNTINKKINFGDFKIIENTEKNSINSLRKI
jgi:hypothetical protein